MTTANKLRLDHSAASTQNGPTEHFDVLIVGAGLSGIGAACHLARGCPGKRFAVLEAREASGGAWDLFRFPGVRSDSDMFTMGYSFRPWRGTRAIADGASILAYLRETAHADGVDERIRYNRRVVAASWSSATSRWRVEVERVDTGEREQLSCAFLFGCTGYYRYDEGYAPDLPGRDRFHGTTCTERGLRLVSGRELDADLVVTATGLNLLPIGGIEIRVDQRRIELGETVAYKGMMLADVPNFAFTIGYTNASWTLKADLVDGHVCRLLRHMDRRGTRICTPRRPDPGEPTAPFIALSSGYIKRGIDRFPRQGSRTPWRLNQSYRRDVALLRRGSVEDPAIEFSEPAPPARDDPITRLEALRLAGHPATLGDGDGRRAVRTVGSGR